MLKKQTVEREVARDLVGFEEMSRKMGEKNEELVWSQLDASQGCSLP